MRTMNPSKKMKYTKQLALCAGLAALLASDARAADPLSTAITYQGRLSAAGQPASGWFDLRFELFDHPTAASSTGSVATNLNVLATNGVFTTLLDFGAGIFTGDMYWLEIGLRPAGSPGTFSLLTPRQPLTAAPYALYAANAGALQGGGGTGWSLTGNAGTSPATDFLGTTDNQALEFRVNSVRGFRLEPTSTTPNILAGDSGNLVTAGVEGATIGGGAAQVVDTGGQLGTIPGGYGARVSHYGQLAYANGFFDSAGDAQTSVYVLRCSTSNGSTTEMFLDGASERLTIPAGSRWAFDVTVVASTSTGTAGAWRAEGLIKNVSGATSFVGSSTPITAFPIARDNASHVVTVEASSFRSALVINVNGSAATLMRWVARVRTVELSY